ncbi:NAD-binding protein [Glycomyces sp. TRM65418]|uniref:CASTOR/POLLUX-related putative ion channel n=1 Tax=Glycomyces sp. TRM65418 TaxID=2867006 RepID=UPI001CE4C9AD|nr:NAD-binding protein [Glycomyces sp. TRM65418]MCC3765771.1 NAD-binding protein [Glycomyces sp. TRM65418]QZD55361.1 NAD-binding protein [Glycomyces sp. TRM65418]
MSEPTFKQRTRYWFDNTMSKGTKALIGWLTVITLALTAMGALFLLFVGKGDGVGGTLWTSFIHILDAGTITGAEDGVGYGYMVIMFATTIGGLVILSSLVGVLTTGLDAKLEDLRKGRSLVVEKDHTVILGWSDQVFIVISELVEANASEKRACIAILADRDKVEMEDEIRAKIPDLKSTHIVCRTGDPADLDDIGIVNPGQAKSVILLTSAEDDPDAQLVRSLLAVTQGRGGLKCHVVGAVEDGRNLPAARLAGGRAAHVVDANDLMARLMVQTCRQSGLSVVYTDLLDFGGDEIYMVEEPGLFGRPLSQAMHSYRTSSFIGVLTKDGRCIINPPSSAALQPGDKLILIAADDSAIVLDGSRPVIDESAIVARAEAGSRPERTLILGWNAKTRMVLEQLDQYVAPGSITDVVSDHPDAAEAIRKIGPTMRVQGLNFKEDDPTDRRLLESLNPGSYDHIIALCADDVAPQMADSKTLVTLLHLRDMAQRAGQKFKVVSEMADDRNRSLAQVTQADDFIVSDKIISLLLTQTAENPHLSQVFGQLFSPEGSEIYLKPAEHYVRTGVPVNFYTVVESARRRGEAAMGYRVAAQAQQAPDYGVRLNPDKGTQFMLQPGDKIVVLAED